MNCPSCGMSIKGHEAGRCLDAWMAKAVMGWTREWLVKSKRGKNRPHYLDKDYILTPPTGWIEQWEKDNPGKACGFSETRAGLPDYAPLWSATGNGMLLVVEEMQKKHWRLTLWNSSLGDESITVERWWANFATEQEVREGVLADASAAPLAVCQAALMVMERTR